MSSHHYDTLETNTEVPVWAVLVTLGILALTWAVSTLAIEAHAASGDRGPEVAAIDLRIC